MYRVEGAGRRSGGRIEERDLEGLNTWSMERGCNSGIYGSVSGVGGQGNALGDISVRSRLSSLIDVALHDEAATLR